MQNFRTIFNQLTSLIGIIMMFWLLTMTTGYLVGIVTPEKIVTSIAELAVRIESSKISWWLGILAAWPALGFIAWTLLTVKRENPLTIREDETGAVEVAPSAIRRLAEATIKSQGGPTVQKTEFVTEFGKPTVKVWCDLTSGLDGEGPLQLGNRLRGNIETRLKEDFSLEGVRVNLVHQSKKGASTPSQIGHA